MYISGLQLHTIFFPNNLVLVQHRIGDYSYTTRFKFNSNGYLLEEWTDDSDNLGDMVRKATTIFYYNNHQQLTKKRERNFHDNKFNEERVTSVFYTDQKIDSVVMFVNSARWGINKIVD